MSPIEDEIRGALRSEAARLCEVRPLRLAPAAGRQELRAAPRAFRARGAGRGVRAPLAAAAAVLLVAAVLVTLRSLRDEQPAPSGPLSTTAGTVPRYFMSEEWVQGGAGKSGMVLAWVVTDAETGKQAGSVPVPGFSPGDGPYLGEPVAAAADDRTFVTAVAVTRPGTTTSTASRRIVQGSPVLVSLKWYLVRFSPGSADPLRLAPLPLPSSTAAGGVSDMALSGDGTELAVVYGASGHVTLRVYSVATGQLRHSWAVTVPGPPKGNGNPFAASFARLTNLSWVGDTTVGFTFTSHPDVRKDIHEDVRTLNIDASGTGLLSASRAVWSLDVPVATYANYGGWGTPDQACNSPRLSGNGQVVVCGIATYSAASRRLTTTWLAYPIADPARPRVLASDQAAIPAVDARTLGPTSTVDWVNASGTTIIGDWSHTHVIHGIPPKAVYVQPSFIAVIGRGTIHRLPDPLGDALRAAW